jgi:hypothetical protein
MMKTDECDRMSEALAGSRPEIEMANGVLIQAKRDLRRFRGAQDPVGRQMFQDAYSWFVSNDFSWPYSFLNVCEILGLTPDYVRDDLLGPTPPGCYARSRRGMQRVSASFRGSLDRLFLTRRGAEKSSHVAQPAPAI